MCPVGSSPDFAGDFLHECDLGPLLFFGEFVADFAGSESTLGTEAEAFERNVLRRLVYAPNHGGFVLQLRSFGGPSTTYLPSATSASGAKLPERSSSNSR